MDGINKSLAAIQAYQPQNHSYLRVVGSGPNQYLEKVKMNWLHRVLMWLGISSASMRKVAKYVAENINALSKVSFDSQEGAKSLGDLVNRIKTYNDHRCFKITPHVDKITRIFNLEKAIDLSKKEKIVPVKPQLIPPEPIATAPIKEPQPIAPIVSIEPPIVVNKPTVIVPIVTATTEVPKSLQPKDKAIKPQLKVIAPIVSIEPPTGVDKPAVIAPIANPLPTPLAVPVTPIPPVNPSFEGVQKFKNARGHIAKVGGLLNVSTASIMRGLTKAANELNVVLNLLRDNKDNPSNFGAIIKEMSSDEVLYYVAFGFYQSEEKRKALPKMCVDVFGIKSDKFNDVSKVMELVVQYMSVDQLKSFIDGIGKYSRDSVKNIYSLAFYNLAMLVEKHRSQTDQQAILKEMVKHSFFSSKIQGEYRDIISGAPELNVKTLLAKHYLFYLFKEPNVADRKKLLRKFIEDLLFNGNGELIPKSPLQDPLVFKELTDPQQEVLASNMLETQNSIIDPIFELVLHIFNTDPKRGIPLFEALGNHASYYAFCCQIREQVPAAEKEYVTYLLRGPNLVKESEKQYKKLCHFMKHGQPHKDSGALEDPNFISTLTSDEIHSVGLAIINAREFGLWGDFYVFREVIMKNKAYALKLYRDGTKYNPGFRKPTIPYYCSGVENIEILDHLEENMDENEKQEWANELVSIYSTTEQFSKLNTIGKHSKVAEIINSILKSPKK